MLLFGLSWLFLIFKTTNTTTIICDSCQFGKTQSRKTYLMRHNDVVLFFQFSMVCWAKPSIVGSMKVLQLAITGDLSCNLILIFLSLLSTTFDTFYFYYPRSDSLSFLSPLHFGSSYLLFTFLVYIFFYINSSYSSCNLS